MNRADLYRKTVDILYQAYFNDTLEHGKCTACAVGNIVAANRGLETKKTNIGVLWFHKNGEHETALWDLVFCTTHDRQQINITNLSAGPARQIASTGYPWQELARIEYAFETAPKGNSAEDYMFNGLVAVLDVLKQLHEVADDAPEVARFEAHRLLRCR